MPSRPSVSRKRDEVNCVPLSVVSVTFASRLPSGSRASTACSTAASASSVRQRCDRFHPAISRVHQSITLGTWFTDPGFSAAQRVHYFWHYVANRMLTLLSDIFTNLKLSDMETCYKVFRRDVLQGIRLKSDRFGFEREITANVARGGNWRVYEVLVSARDTAKREKGDLGMASRLAGLIDERPVLAHSRE